MKARLGINIDHVATLRQARGELYPSLVDAADLAIRSGADQITIHLREDRRHIQDTDVAAIKLVTSRYNVPLNLEMATSDEILQIAIDSKPQWICLVPEKREEKTTEGGLDLESTANFEKIRKTILSLREHCPDTKISLFVEANDHVLKKCIDLKVDAVEIHTGDYARAFVNDEDLSSFLERFSECKNLIKNAGIGYHAGHGLTDLSTKPLVENDLFEEYNIGHWVISDSVFVGLEQSIQKLKNLFK